MAIWADAELTNWAQVYCGRLETEMTRVASDLPTPRALDAARVECALVTMRATRPRLFNAVMLRYRNRWLDVTCSRAMRVSVPTYRQILNRAYAWLDGRLTDSIS